MASNTLNWTEIFFFQSRKFLYNYILKAYCLNYFALKINSLSRYDAEMWSGSLCTRQLCHSKLISAQPRGVSFPQPICSTELPTFQTLISEAPPTISFNHHQTPSNSELLPLVWVLLTANSSQPLAKHLTFLRLKKSSNYFNIALYENLKFSLSNIWSRGRNKGFCIATKYLKDVYQSSLLPILPSLRKHAFIRWNDVPCTEMKTANLQSHPCVTRGP